MENTNNLGRYLCQPEVIGLLFERLTKLETALADQEYEATLLEHAHDLRVWKPLLKSVVLLTLSFLKYKALTSLYYSLTASHLVSHTFPYRLVLAAYLGPLEPHTLPYRPLARLAYLGLLEPRASPRC
jgi:hypothetical protein